MSAQKTPLVRKMYTSGLYPILYFCSDLEHIQRLVDEKQLDEKLKEFRSHESEEKIKLEDFGPMPEMIDDFIRNYFRNMGLNKTLATVILYFYLTEMNFDFYSSNRNGLNSNIKGSPMEKL